MAAISGPPQTAVNEDPPSQGSLVACPDPAAHQREAEHALLQHHASKAALYATHADKSLEKSMLDAQHADGKLSSAGAATSLKQARAQDLPSFPSTGGLASTHSHSAATQAHTSSKPFEHWKPDPSPSAGRAATQAHATSKPFEHWKPESSQSAGRAALLAHDKQRPFKHWTPEVSTAGSRAAILAHRDGGKTQWWSPEASKEGNEAAYIAMGKKGLAPVADSGHADDGRKGALLAATGALRASQRRRSSSTPATEARASSAARRAAGVGSRDVEREDSNRWSSNAMQAARIQHAHAAREMFTANPPVEIEKAEAQHQAALKASALSMAKKMYQVQQSHIEAAAGAGVSGAATAHARSQEAASRQDTIKQAALQHLTLQERAQALAEERLAKMKTDEDKAFRDYYGYDASHSPRSIRNRLSLRGGRRRSSSDVTADASAASRDRWADSDDEEQSRKIRKQMTVLKGQVADVDLKKRQKDRAALLQAAEKKVRDQMADMDEKVFNDTGKMSPAMVEEWENKARLRLEKQREAEAAEKKKVVDVGGAGGEEGKAHSAKIHIGGGMYMTQAEVEEIARNRIKPTLFEIGEQAERQRQKDRQDRLDREEKKRAERIEKEKEQEKKVDEKKAKAEEKAHAKEEKEAEKAKLKEEKRMTKEESRRSKDIRLLIGDSKPPPGDEDERADATLLAASPEDQVAQQDPMVSEAIALSTAPIPTYTESEMQRTLDLEPLPLPLPLPQPVQDTETAAPEPRAPAAAGPAPTASSTIFPASVPATSTETGKNKVIISPTVPTSSSPPVSPTRSEKGGGFRSLFSKLKRKPKEQQQQPGETRSFAGGHRLNKSQRERDEHGGDEAVAASASGSKAAAVTAAATTSAAREGGDSSSVSSPSDSEGESSAHAAAAAAGGQEDEARRGRQRLSVADAVNGAGGSGSGNVGSWESEEARDRFGDELERPQPVFTSKKMGVQSPHRDSKFIERL